MTYWRLLCTFIFMYTDLQGAVVAQWIGFPPNKHKFDNFCHLYYKKLPYAKINPIQTFTFDACLTLAVSVTCYFTFVPNANLKF